MGGGKGGSKAPPPIDPGKSMGEYLFGRGFTSYQGITDPRLQERLIQAESTYRPQYTALELADIAVMARGLEGGKESYQYKMLEAELAGLEAGQEYRSLNTEERRAAVEAKADAIFGAPKEPKGLVGALYKSAKEAGKLNGKTRGPFPTGKGAAPSGRNAYIEAALSDGGDSAERIAQIKAQMKQLEDAPDTPGLFDLLEEQSRRAGALQREELQMQRESDVGALQEFAPQVVEAYRAADPYSTALADEAQAQAMRLFGEAEGELSPERRRLAEQAARAGSLARGRIGDESSIASEILGREQFKAGLRAEARQAGMGAFQQQRQMAGDVGMTILGRPSASIGLGGSVLGQAQAGAAGPMGPQLFDPNVGINMALQQRGQDVTFQGMQAQAKAAGQAGFMGAIGGIGGGLLGNTSLF